MDMKLIARFALRETMGVLLMGIALFWSAGDITWWAAWALIAVTVAWIVATGVVIIRSHPDLLAERLGPRKGAKKWDTTLMGCHGVLQLAMLVVAGLDYRYGWSATIPLAAQIAALIVCALGYGLVVWATASNAFFSQIVRIQTERGHTVATGGPYHYVRHPAYAGGILTQVSTPIILVSWWALIIGIADASLMILRTTLEDRTLMIELPGFPEYAGSVRHRLVPGLW
ncbi:MAG: isoprenylcysteine carboxylmethyltransferase family protein [Anaerolineae bacterium]